MTDVIHHVAVESYTLYAIGISLISCRMVSRRMKLGGWSKLQMDDYLMMFVMITFTCDIFAVNEVAKNGSNYLPYDFVVSLSPEGRAKAIYGSKMSLAMAMFTQVTIWTIKACLLILYHRLTLAYPAAHLAVKLVAGFCVLGFTLVVTFLLTLWCQPIQQYWQLPVENSQCATYFHHMIFATSFNISSDLMLLCIPIPIVIRSNLPTRRKIILCCVLGLGVSNIIAAIMNRYYNFAYPNDFIYVYWYVGELATAVYVGNIALCWPLVRGVFHLDTWSWLVYDRSSHGPNDWTVQARTKRFPGGRAVSTLPRSLWETMNSTLDTKMQTRNSDDLELRGSLPPNASQQEICDLSSAAADYPRSPSPVYHHVTSLLSGHEVGPDQPSFSRAR